MVEEFTFPSSNQKQRRLYRSEYNRVIAGVAGGLSEYFAIPPVVFRALFLALSFVWGIGIGAYLVLWFLLPSQSSLNLPLDYAINQNMDEFRKKTQVFIQSARGTAQKADENRPAVGILLIVFGLFFLLNNVGLFRFTTLLKLWPLLLVVVGFKVLFRK